MKKITQQKKQEIIDLIEKISKPKKDYNLALQWIEKIEDILIECAYDIWGEGDWSTAIIGQGEEKDFDKTFVLYLRYESFGDRYNPICPYRETGLYLTSKYYYESIPFKGDRLYRLNDKLFWNAIEIFLNSLPKLLDKMHKIDDYKQKILSQINIEF